jgi:exopolysaccharide biosynthesis polyprenyl glycosylphosphotransferase
VLTASFLAAWWIRFGSGWMAFAPPAPSFDHYLHALPVTLLAWLSALNYAGLYQRRAHVVGGYDGARLVGATAAAILLVTAAGFLYRDFSYSRLVLGIMAVLDLAGLRVARMGLSFAQDALRRRGVGVVRVAIVGDGRAARAAAAVLARHPDYGFRVAGYVGARGSGIARWLGTYDSLECALRRARPDEIILAPGERTPRGAVLDLARRCAASGAEVVQPADHFGSLTSRIAMEERFGMPLLVLRPLPLAAWRNRAVKRALDLVLSLAALLLLAPLLLAVAAAVRLESPGPALYRQVRVGRAGRRFSMLKFRSMLADAERRTGPVWTKAGDPRRTRLGAFLRRTSLDELPQLLNVLRGDMSLVGPRPERPVFVRRFARVVPRYDDRHLVRPGVTGWAQINGLRGNAPIADRTTYDLSYIENWSLWLDLRILFRTGLEVFHHQEAY